MGIAHGIAKHPWEELVVVLAVVACRAACSLQWGNRDLVLVVCPWGNQALVVACKAACSLKWALRDMVLAACSKGMAVVTGGRLAWSHCARPSMSFFALLFELALSSIWCSTCMCYLGPCSWLK